MFRTERKVSPLGGSALVEKVKEREGRFRNAYTEEHATRNTVMKIRCAAFRLLNIVVHLLSGFPRICSQVRTAMKE